MSHLAIEELKGTSTIAAGQKCIEFGHEGLGQPSALAIGHRWSMAGARRVAVEDFSVSAHSDQLLDHALPGLGSVTSLRPAGALRLPLTRCARTRRCGLWCRITCSLPRSARRQVHDVGLIGVVRSQSCGQKIARLPLVMPSDMFVESRARHPPHRHAVHVDHAGAVTEFAVASSPRYGAATRPFSSAACALNPDKRRFQ